jgi:formylglycine-generating enzyme required for sulfatase activity
MKRPLIWLIREGRGRRPWRCALALGAFSWLAVGLMAESSAARFENSLGQRFVPVPGTPVWFCIWDVRVQDFAAFVAATGYDATAQVVAITAEGWKQNGATWRSPGFPQGPFHPVCGINWADAQAFCAWLTAKEQREHRLHPGERYRLPTDAEWSLAAGLAECPGTPAEKESRPARAYPWGASWPPRAGSGNYAGEEARDGHWPADGAVIAGYRDGFARTSPVASFPPNRFGLYDMSGNVWQWCEDWREPAHLHRALRGGSFYNASPKDLLLTRRPDFDPPESRAVNFGMRCVLVRGWRGVN